MKKTELFKVNEETDQLINEIAALTGYGRNVVKEVLEFLLINWAIKLADHPEAPADLSIPYLGTVSVAYAGDEELPNGSLYTKVDSKFTPSASFRHLVGVIQDEGFPEIVKMLEKKIEQVVMVVCSPE